MSSPGEDVYATLLLNDSYLPGALVLAHSLKDAGTTKRLVVLVTTDTVSRAVIAQLESVFDEIIPIDRVVNESPANLFLMDRPDLHSTFTKIALWKLTQFRKIVYVDADIVALRAPDELFDIPHPFSAAPDIGWPDIFNTGVMVLTPNLGDYYTLQAMAQRGISFDGADQGLLNIHFKNTYNRISFTYNVTPSAHYQYLPAYRHFQSSVSMAHFIGKNKPWTEGRREYKGSSPYDEMVERWWTVYDKHYRESSADSPSEATPAIVQYHTKGEYRPVIPLVVIEASSPSPENEVIQQPTTQDPIHEPEPTPEAKESPEQQQEAYVQPVEPHVQTSEPHVQTSEPYVERVETYEDKGKQPEIYSSWDASKAPPPIDSRPEASNFPATHYDMSSDPTPWKAPEKYPDPPKDMWYEVPKTPTHQKLAPIFPWEKYAPPPTRDFPDDKPQVTEAAATGESDPSEPTVEETEKSSPATPTTPSVSLTPADTWSSYTRGNAWDDIPEIERYIGNLQRNRKGNIQVLQGYGTGISDVSSPGSRRAGMKLTDFPTELERPSLPVTPAPIRRPNFWGGERGADGELPAAVGVPSQEEWDPAEKLEQLARRQSDVLERKLGEGAREIPTRSLPYGSEGVISPTYVKQTSKDSAPRPAFEEPSYGGSGAQWEKDETFPSHQTPALPSEEEKDVLET